MDRTGPRAVHRPNVMGRLYWWGMCLGASPQDAITWLDEHIEQRPNDRFARLSSKRSARKGI